MKSPVIGFAGMTHLGLVSGVAASERGFTLVCFDPVAARVQALSMRELPVSEPLLDELLGKNSDRISFTASPADIVQCDVIFVAPDVPTDDQGKSDLAPINALLDVVFDVARTDAVIVVLSQVPPGYTRSKQRDGRRLYYQVETLVFGRAVERALYPERFIVGCADPTEPLAPQYAAFLAAHGCPILPMLYESAELAKISINMCLVASISTANTLAEICEKIGADWSEIVPALKLDRRIGPHSYLSPGLGIAGGNLERDLATVCSFGDKYQTDVGVVRAWLDNSRHRRDWAVRAIREMLLAHDPRAVVAVWGLAYKENTNSVKNSPSLATITQLQGTALRLHDPVVPATAAKHETSFAASDPIDAVRGADALMILTPWPQYREVAPANIAQAMRGCLVIDPYGVLDRQAASTAGLQLHSLGRPT